MASGSEGQEATFWAAAAWKHGVDVGAGRTAPPWMSANGDSARIYSWCGEMLAVAVALSSSAAWGCRSSCGSRKASVPDAFDSNGAKSASWTVAALGVATGAGGNCECAFTAGISLDVLAGTEVAVRGILERASWRIVCGDCGRFGASGKRGLFETSSAAGMGFRGYGFDMPD